MEIYIELLREMRLGKGMINRKGAKRGVGVGTG